MVVELEIRPSDWAAYQAHFAERARARVGRARRLAATVGPLAAGALLVYLRSHGRAATPLLAFGIGMLVMSCAVLLSSRAIRPSTLPEADGLLLGPLRLELSSGGMRTWRPLGDATTRWQALREITYTDSHAFLWIDKLAALIVPLRDLSDGQLDALFQTIRTFGGPIPIARTGRGVGVSIPGATPSPPGFLSALWRRLTWRCVPADAKAQGSSDAMITVCAGAALGVWLGYDHHVAGANPEWSPGGLTSIVWYAAGVLALAWVLHRGSFGAVAFRPLLAAIAGALPALLALGVAARLWLPERTHATCFALLGVAALLHVARTLREAGGHWAAGAVLPGVLFVALFWAATSAAWVYPHVWYAARDDDGGHAWADSERMLFSQADQIDAAAAKMTAAQPHRPDLFFVGFAGDADQKVFAEELRLTERVVTQKYGAVGRSLLLVNDNRDHERWPIATTLGLRRALARVAARMDLEDDVLFLMLTSHGSEQPSLTVSNGAWPLVQLDGRELRSALDASGIRWRVIVISACHSGAFIEPLASETTIVLSASAKERTSFGCDDKSELTYFGQALMRDALPRAESLASAFERAKQLIAEREQREKLEASLPQAYFGAAIRSHWTALENATPRSTSAAR